MKSVHAREQYDLVQALRGVAALWVVLFHASEGGHIPALTALLPSWLTELVFDSGHYGVAIFFALSGFVIAHSLSGANVTLSHFGRFVVRRSLRLDPAYWASMLLVIGLSFISALAKKQVFHSPGVGQIAAHLSYLQELLRVPEINSVYWTLTFEVQFYLFFALALVVARMVPTIGRATGKSIMRIVLFIIAMLAASDLLDAVPHGLFVPLWACFYVGVLARDALDEVTSRGALLVLAAILLFRSPFAQISAATAVLLWGATSIGWATNGLNWRWLQFLGTISYSLYLVHNPVSGALGFVVRSVLGSGVVSDLVALIAILGGSLAAATALWWAVEQPSHRLSKRVRLFRLPHGPVPVTE